MCAGIHSNPGPSQPKTIVQFNCNGVWSSKTEIQDFIDANQVKIVDLQETKLHAKSKQPNFQNYNLVRWGRPVGWLVCRIASVRCPTNHWGRLRWWRRAGRVRRGERVRREVIKGCMSTEKVSGFTRMSPKIKDG
jgi:hypothetical protein